MHFKILGPLSVADKGTEMAFAGNRQSTILAMLLLTPNRVVHTGQLIEAVWGEAAPQTAANQIQICVSRLRRVLDAHDHPHRLLITSGPGYLIRIEPGQLDALAFADLRAQAEERFRAGRVCEAVEKMRAALALWRGPALAGLNSELVTGAAAHLDEQRLHAHEQLIDWELSLGHHQRLVGELRQLTNEHPFRERLHGMLMVSLYRSGQQSEALMAYQNLRAILDDSLGLEPGDEIRRLQHAILNQDRDLLHPEPGAQAGATPATPRQLPAVVSCLTGRDPELKQVLDRFEAADDLRLPVVAIVGQPGAGKTALALEAAHRLSDSYSDGQLYADMTDLEPVDVLGRFLRTLGVSGQLPSSLGERAAMFRTLTSGRRLLLVLDGMNSGESVADLLPGSATCGVLITGLRRPAAMPESGVIRLSPLSLDDAVEFLSRELGTGRSLDGVESMRGLAEACGRLPLALRIAGARLAAKPHWSITALLDRLSDSRTVFDELTYGDLGMRASLFGAYTHLGADAQALLRRIGLLESHQAPLWLIAQVAGWRLADTAEVVEDLVDAHFLEPVNDRCYGWHPLVHAFARERLLHEDSGAEWAGSAFCDLEKMRCNRIYGDLSPLCHAKDG